MINIKIILEDKETGKVLAERTSYLWEVAEMNLESLKNWWKDQLKKTEEQALFEAEQNGAALSEENNKGLKS